MLRFQCISIDDIVPVLVLKCLTFVTDMSAAPGQSVGHKMWPHLLLSVLKELPQDPAAVSCGPSAAGRTRRPVLQHPRTAVSTQTCPCAYSSVKVTITHPYVFTWSCKNNNGSIIFLLKDSRYGCRLDLDVNVNYR